VRVWHYLPDRWSGDAAEALYRGPIIKALRRNFSTKRRFTILEDNDPTGRPADVAQPLRKRTLALLERLGYKSNKAIGTKAELKIDPMPFPRYSPELNPCDFALWNEVARRMDATPAPKNESIDAYKARLRRAAMGIPKSVVVKMLLSIRKRAHQVWQAKGGDIPRD
jgi:hypothetical protein